jgi:hypothetical protein
MDLFTPMWAYWLSQGGSVPESGTGKDVPAPRRPAVDDLDAELIRMAYTVGAAGSTCCRCGAALGRGLTIGPPCGASVASVVTRCRGWRSHRHVATVSEVSGHLLLGPFGPAA